MWLWIVGIVIFIALVGLGLYYFRTVDYVPYPNCNAGNYVWDIKFYPSTFTNMASLISDLSKRVYETGPSYPIYIKTTIIGTVANGRFTSASGFSNITPGSYRLTPISSNNLCQSNLVTIKGK